jgi:hypothetical protein
MYEFPLFLRLLLSIFRSRLNAYSTIVSLCFCHNALDEGKTFAAREDAIRVKNLVRSPSSSHQREGGDELTPTQQASGSFEAVCPFMFPFIF